MDLILLDDNLADLRPLCDLRASFELRTGALTTSERLVSQVGMHAAALWVRAEMAELIASRHSEPVNKLPGGGPFLVVNGRCARLTIETPTVVNTAVVDSAGAVIAALLDRATAETMLASGFNLPGSVRTTTVKGAPLLMHPWHVLEQAAANLDHDLSILARRLHQLEIEPAPRVTIVGKHRVMIGKDTVVHPHVVFDTSDGPICIDDRAVVRSMSVMVGPGYIGRDSIVVNHAHIRGHNIIGPWCKVGGEVNSCLFQGYANKAHSGYLGNSFVGEWVNLGADTVTSNLKNTYGEVRMQLDAGVELRTGMQFLGTIFGDHGKTSIGTRMLTGSVMHTGAMLATSGFPPKCIAPFAFITEKGEEKYQLDKFFGVAEAVMKRRGMTVTPQLKARLEALHGK